MSTPTQRSSRLLERDINKSLGKLPPHAPDLEEAVLGAVLIESNALAAVIDFLKPQHFYTEANLIIYQAVVDLHKAKASIDMRTIVAHLTRVGKLELIGGAFKIAEMTSKVSSAANIEYHARIIVEKAMMRNLIEIASQIHHDAYEPQSDVFEMLDSAEKIIKGIHDNSIVESDEQKIRKLWAERLIVEEPSEPAPWIKIGDTSIAIAGNHTLLVGKKKSRKTLFIVWLVSEFLKNHPKDHDEVLIFDTEQGKSHVYKMRQKIKKICGKDVPTFYLRGLTHDERIKFITWTIRTWHKKPKIIIIDGIRDLMADINDSDESNNLIYWLEKTTIDHDIAILNVLHLNKTDRNPRGHIGTELTNKALATIELELDEKSQHTIVKCESSRERGFENFAFTHGPDGGPEIVGMPVGGNSIPVAERIARLKSVFKDEPQLSYKELIGEIKAEFALGDNKGKALVKEFVRKGWLMSAKNGKTTIYKFTNPIANEDGIVTITTPMESPIESPPPGLFDSSMTLQDQVGDEASDDNNVEDLPF